MKTQKQTNYVSEMLLQESKFKKKSFLNYINHKIITEPLLFVSIFILLPLNLILLISLLQ